MESTRYWCKCGLFIGFLRISHYFGAVSPTFVLFQTTKRRDLELNMCTHRLVRHLRNQSLSKVAVEAVSVSEVGFQRCLLWQWWKRFVWVLWQLITGGNVFIETPLSLSLWICSSGFIKWSVGRDVCTEMLPFCRKCSFIMSVSDAQFTELQRMLDYWIVFSFESLLDVIVDGCWSFKSFL